jgi:hypothetical protein
MSGDLSNRPLTGRVDDAAKYVRRPADETVDRSLELGFNVLLSAPRGMGATSSLYRLESHYGDRSTYLNAATISEGQVLLQVLNERLASGLPERLAGTFSDLIDPIASLQRRLEARGVGPASPWFVLLDGPVSPVVAHEIFGGLRDRIFALPMRWVVIAPADRVGQYLSPPADAFFEQVVHLDRFPQAELLAMLQRRGVELPPPRFAEVLQLGDGSPRQLLGLARQAVLEPQRPLADRAYEDWQARRASLSRSASILFDEIRGHPPIAATDPTLLQRLDWTEARSRRAFQELVNAGLVRASEGATDGPGRPPTVYQIAPGPPGANGDA